jgi:N utilization substance protein A
VDIDLSVLKLMESEREIPFDELVVIIEQAIWTPMLLDAEWN